MSYQTKIKQARKAVATVAKRLETCDDQTALQLMWQLASVKLRDLEGFRPAGGWPKKRPLKNPLPSWKTRKFGKWDDVARRLLSRGIKADPKFFRPDWMKPKCARQVYVY